MATHQPDQSATEPNRSRPSWWFRLLRGALLTYVFLLIALVFFEERLIFFPAKYPAGDWNPRTSFDDVQFTAEDGTKLHGWYVAPPDPSGYLLYCHGNAGNVTSRIYAADELRQRYNLAVFVFDYRGYGRSEGKPSESGVLIDGKAAQQWLASRAGKSVDELFVLGRSLGGGVAVDLASKYGAKGLILQNTFSSLPDVAAPIYWFVPVRLMMRSKLDSASKIGDYHGPVLICHGTNDRVVPFTLGQKLFDAANEPKWFVAHEGGGHESGFPASYYEQLETFIKQ